MSLHIHDFGTKSEQTDFMFGLQNKLVAQALRKLADRMEEGGDLHIVEVNINQRAVPDDFAHTDVVLTFCEKVPQHG